jgi:hypothetical protein
MPAFHPRLDFGPRLRDNSTAKLPQVALQPVLAAPVQDYGFCLVKIEPKAKARLPLDQLKCLLAAIRSYQQGRPLTGEEAVAAEAFNSAVAVECQERRLIAARQELGPDATIEQLALHCNLGRAPSNWSIPTLPLQRLGAAKNKERQVMTKPLQHVSRRCAGFPLSAILMLTVRRTLDGRPRQVLHLRATAVLNPVNQSCSMGGTR